MNVHKFYHVLILLVGATVIGVWATTDMNLLSPIGPSGTEWSMASPASTPPGNDGNLESLREVEANLKALKGTDRLEDLINSQRNIEYLLGKTGGPNYGMLYRNLLAALTTEKIIESHPEALGLAQDYVEIALRRSDSFDFETEWFLLMYLRYPTNEASLDNSQIEARRRRTDLWLHLLKRIDDEKDTDFDQNDLPALNVQPPEGSNIIAGMSPDAITDPVLREQYKAAIKKNSENAAYFSHQIRLRQDEDSIIKNAVKYISLMYSKVPYNSDELRNALDKYAISDDIILRISKEISNYKDVKL